MKKFIIAYLLLELLVPSAYGASSEKFVKDKNCRAYSSIMATVIHKRNDGATKDETLIALNEWFVSMKLPDESRNTLQVIAGKVYDGEPIGITPEQEFKDTYEWCMVQEQ